MRDILVTALILGSIPFILKNPFVGLLMWIWVGIMNPHRLTWGFAYDMPFAQIVAISTLLSIAMHTKQLYSPPRDRVAVFLVLFVLWLGVSPLFAFHPERELALWLSPIKILFMSLLALVLVGNRDQLHRMVWVVALSIGFFGIKGGIFTITHGGASRVMGPAGSFIQENNALALAIIMTVPLFRYLQLHSENVWVRRGCVAAMGLCAVSALGSWSRGAFLAIIAMGFFLFVKSRQKALIAMLVLAVVPFAYLVMPEAWFDRMATINTYQEDSSAMSRINSWLTAWNVALARFPIGGGFAMWTREVFARYAPNPDAVFVAHSIYFQVLGEHGFIGLFLFLAIFGLSWLNASWVIKMAKDRADLLWAKDLAAMCQVSLMGYAVGGAFLSLTYFDLPYYIVITLIILRMLVQKSITNPATRPEFKPA